MTAPPTRNPPADAARRPQELEALLFGGGGGSASEASGASSSSSSSSSGGGEASETSASGASSGGEEEEAVEEPEGEEREGEVVGDLRVVFDDTAGDPAAGEGEGEDAADGEGAGRAPKKRLPAWEDADDARAEVDLAGRAKLRKLRVAPEETTVDGGEFQKRLRARHARLHPRTEWAALPAAEAGAAEASGLPAEAEAVRERERRIPGGRLEVLRLEDANVAEPSNAVVRAVDFHPSGRLLLTGGMDKKLRVFQVDGAKNPRAFGVFFEDMPILGAAFARGGDLAIAAGRRPFFYSVDVAAQRAERVNGLLFRQERSLESFAVSPPGAAGPPLVAFLGRDGTVPLVSLRDHVWLHDLKMPGEVRAAAFSPCGTYLVTHGLQGVVYRWDLRTRRCVDKCVDSGCLKGTALACAPGGGFAAGQDSGVVNYYGGWSGPGRAAARRTVFGGDGRAVATTAPLAGLPQAPAARAPTAEFMSLTTKADALAFNHDGDLLAMASSLKRNSMRVAHVPSGTVYANWPTSKTPLHYVHCLAFSPSSDMLAVGNARGKCLLYRLKHYSQDV